MLKLSSIQVNGNKIYTALMKNVFFCKKGTFFRATAYVVFVFIVLNFIKVVEIMFVYFYITPCKRNKCIYTFIIVTDGFKTQI